MQLSRKFKFFCCIIFSYHALHAASTGDNKEDAAVEFNGVRYTVEEAKIDCVKFIQKSSNMIGANEEEKKNHSSWEQFGKECKKFVFTLGILQKSQHMKLSVLFPKFTERCKNGHKAEQLRMILNELFKEFIQVLYPKNDSYHYNDIDPSSIAQMMFNNETGVASVNGDYAAYLKSNFPFLALDEFKPLLKKFVFFFTTLKNASEKKVSDVGTEKFALSIIDQEKDTKNDNETNGERKNSFPPPFIKKLIGAISVGSLCICLYFSYIHIMSHQNKKVLCKK